VHQYYEPDGIMYRKHPAYSLVDILYKH